MFSLIIFSNHKRNNSFSSTIGWMVNLYFTFILMIENEMFSWKFKFNEINGIFYSGFIIYMLHFTKISFNSIFTLIENRGFLIFFIIFWINTWHRNRFVNENKISWSLNVGLYCYWWLRGSALANSLPIILFTPSERGVKNNGIFGSWYSWKLDISSSYHHIKEEFFS